MTKVQESGKAKAIGVSNFGIENLEKLLKAGGVVPAGESIGLACVLMYLCSILC